MKDIEIKEIPREQYASFLASVSHSAFHRLAWLEAIQSTFGLTIRLLGYFHHNSLIAVTPIMGRRIGILTIWGAPLRKCATPPAIPFCSPSSYATSLYPSLKAWIGKEGLGFFQLTIPDVNSSELLFSADRIESLDNLEIDLKPSLEDLWSRLPGFSRRCVRKSVRSGVKVHWSHRLDQLKIQNALVGATYGRQGIRPNIPAHLYAKLLTNRADSGVYVLCASHHGKKVAAIWVFVDSSRCYYWDAASLGEARKLNANHLLVWCLVRWARRKGIKTFDFVGTSTGGRGGSRPGIGRFKQSMGGIPQKYSILYLYSPTYLVAFKIYRLFNSTKNRIRARNLLGSQ